MNKKELENYLKRSISKIDVPDQSDEILKKYQVQKPYDKPVSIFSHRLFVPSILLGSVLVVVLGVLFFPFSSKEDRVPVCLSSGKEQIGYSVLSTSSILDLTSKTNVLETNRENKKYQDLCLEELSSTQIDSYLQDIYPYMPTVEAMLYGDFSLSTTIVENHDEIYQEYAYQLLVEEVEEDQAKDYSLFYSVYDIEEIPHFNKEVGVYQFENALSKKEKNSSLDSAYYIKGILVCDSCEYFYEAFRVFDVEGEESQLSFDSYTYLNDSETDYIHIRKMMEDNDDGLFEVYAYELCVDDEVISNASMCFEKDDGEATIFLSINQLAKDNIQVKIGWDNHKKRFSFFSNIKRPLTKFFADIIIEDGDSFYHFYGKNNCFEKKLKKF